MFVKRVQLQSFNSLQLISKMSTLPPNSRRNLIAVCQLTSQHEFQKNFDVCAEMVARAKARDCKMVFFPECFDYIARSAEESLKLGLEESGEYIGQFRELAKKNGLWLSLGGFHNKTSESPEKLPNNTHLVIDDKGETRSAYNKLHLFDLDLPGKVRLMESELYRRGEELVPPVDTPIGRLGLSICYDVRFPELSLYNRYKGAEVLSFPSSFTLNTGLAHWETLLRTRAIETQCYVVAAAQTGKHNEKRSSYGHSMVVDPWGAMIAQCSERIDMCFAEIDLDYVAEVRKSQPVFPHRRSDLYSLIFNENLPSNEDLKFAIYPVQKETIFYRTSLTFAFTNVKCVLPGHVLVSPIRLAKRLTDLTDQETGDLFIVVRKVEQMLKAHYGADSATVVVQDGPESGQTVPHVHVHIMPRKKGDFGDNPDKLYKVMEEHEKNGGIPLRSNLDMAKEAGIYRGLMNKNP